MTIECRPITAENADALALPNDPFPENGRVIPMYDGADWSYRIEEFPPERRRMNCFPDENYRFEEMGEAFRGIAAYADGVCAGYAVLYQERNRWLYLDNLLVCGKYRRNGVGSALINASMALAERMGLSGVRLVCQDNNLNAVKFYFANGFTLGGMDLPVYEGTKQEGKADLFLYKRIER